MHVTTHDMCCSQVYIYRHKSDLIRFKTTVFFFLLFYSVLLPKRLIGFIYLFLINFIALNSLVLFKIKKIKFNSKIHKKKNKYCQPHIMFYSVCIINIVLINSQYCEPIGFIYFVPFVVVQQE